MDRKAVDPPGRAHYYWSLSARRAWIEKTLRLTLYLSIMVALRKESVDRNTRSPSAPTAPSWSLSARRAWIEILLCGPGARQLQVALRKESVDRNLPYQWGVWTTARRSPQGERG